MYSIYTLNQDVNAPFIYVKHFHTRLTFVRLCFPVVIWSCLVKLYWTNIFKYLSDERHDFLFERFYFSLQQASLIETTLSSGVLSVSMPLSSQILCFYLLIVFLKTIVFSKYQCLYFTFDSRMFSKCFMTIIMLLE